MPVRLDGAAVALTAALALATGESALAEPPGLSERLAAVLDADPRSDTAREPIEATPLWHDLQREPLEAVALNLARQYESSLTLAGYAGLVGDSASYGGAAFGFQADLSSPLCRYAVASLDGQALAGREEAGLAYDGQVGGCLPIGPFAIELALRSRRGVRVGLAAPPTSRASRFDALGVELGVRGYRWLDRSWELVVTPVDVTVDNVSTEVSDGTSSAQFGLSAAALRTIHHGIGPGGGDRTLEVIPVRVLGSQADSGERAATVVGVGAIGVTGARLSPRLFLSAEAQVHGGHAGATTLAMPTEIVVTGAVDVALSIVELGWTARMGYKRGLIPDDQLRVLVEDRADAAAAVLALSGVAHVGAFAAYTRTAARSDVAARSAAASYGLQSGYERRLTGPVWLALDGQAARSYYAQTEPSVLDLPEWELRITAAVIASWSGAGWPGVDR